MEKYPKKISENLRDGESIIYQAEKSSYNHFCDFLVLPSILITSAILIIIPFLLKINILYLLAEIPFIIFLYVKYIQYEVHLYLTNQRIIVFHKFNSKIVSYELQEITTFEYNNSQYVPCIEIGDEHSKTNVCNIKVEKFEEEFRKLMPNFVSQKTKRKMNKQEIICIFVCLLAIPSMYLQSNIYNSQKAQELQAYQEVLSDNEFIEYNKNMFSKITQNTDTVILEAPQGEKVTAEFKLLSDGTVENERIVRESFNKSFNNATFNAIAKSAPFPELPEQAKALAPLKIRYNVLIINEKKAKVCLEIMQNGKAVTRQSVTLNKP